VLSALQAEALIAQGADPSARDKHGRGGAHYAASAGAADVLALLATKGCGMGCGLCSKLRDVVTRCSSCKDPCTLALPAETEREASR
jgi:hypothetical protein